MLSEKISKLNRFTTLPILLDLLERKKLTLLNPILWEDKNDSEIILEYKRIKSIKNLFALCFSYNDETIHHWKTFSNGPSGCLIEFDAAKLISHVNKIPGIIQGKVEYKKIKEIKESKISIEKIPFTKRWPYRCEEEYRIIFETEKEMDFFEIDIQLDFIKKVTISQQMPNQIFETIKKQLKSSKDKVESRINKSTLFENRDWINSFKEYNS